MPPSLVWMMTHRTPLKFGTPFQTDTSTHCARGAVSVSSGRAGVLPSASSCWRMHSPAGVGILGWQTNGAGVVVVGAVTVDLVPQPASSVAARVRRRARDLFMPAGYSLPGRTAF